MPISAARVVSRRSSAGASYASGCHLKSLLEPGHLASSIAAVSAAAAFFAFASTAVVSLAGRARETLTHADERFRKASLLEVIQHPSVALLVQEYRERCLDPPS